MARATDIIADAEANEREILYESVELLAGELRKSEWDRTVLEEHMSNLDLYLDQAGWTSLAGLSQYAEDGPDLAQLHRSSQHIRKMRVMNVWVKRGLSLRAGYIWDGGIHYDIPKRATKRGRPSKEDSEFATLKDRMKNPVNQRNFFSQSAREEREAALYCDSQPFYIGDDSEFTIRQVPITAITGSYANPDYPDEVWAYRHSWMPTNQDGTPATDAKHEWIFLNAFVDQRGRRDSISNGDGTSSPVARTKRMFGNPVNANSGWTFGVPDALGAMAWAEQYRQFMLSGKKMSDAMSKIWAVAAVNTQKGADNIGVRMGGGAGNDNLAVMGVSQSLSPMSTAGQSYDFKKGLDLLAAFAAGVDVSVVALSANPAAAGGSYGAAKALDLPEQLTTTARRQYHIDLDREVMTWLGYPEERDIWFDPIVESSEMYRDIQGIMLKWGTGMYQPEEIKYDLQALLGRYSISDIPNGIMLPNNEQSAARRDIDPNTTGPQPSASNGGGFTPTQGSGADTNPTGGQDQNAGDLRNRDTE